jgi:ATP-dependent protease ClpP protease subunit
VEQGRPPEGDDWHAEEHEGKEAAGENVGLTVYVSFSAEINANTTESLLATLANCATERAETVYLLLSTPGGTVMNGINLYNAMRAMPFKLITHNVGNVDPSGTPSSWRARSGTHAPTRRSCFTGSGSTPRPAPTWWRATSEND